MKRVLISLTWPANPWVWPDLFIFARGTVDSANMVCEALEESKQSSGLVTSIPQSKAYFSNIPNVVKHAILMTMLFEEGTLHVKYFGVPLISSQLLYRDCKVLIERLKCRIVDWKNKSLSFVGPCSCLESGWLRYGFMGGFGWTYESVLDLFGLNMVRMISGMDSVPPRFEDGVAFLIPSFMGCSARSIISHIVLATACYFIWQERNTRTRMTRSSSKNLITPYENPEQKFRSSRKLSRTRSLDRLDSPESNLFSNYVDQFEEEETETMGEPTMEEYMTKTRDEYRSRIVRPKIDDKARFELKGQFLKELRDNTFSGSDNEDANEHIEKVLEIVDLFHIPEVTQDQIMLRVFPMSLTKAASRWLRNEPAGLIEVILFHKGLDVPTWKILDSKGVIPSMNVADAKKAIQEMAEHSQKWHNGMSTRTRSTDTSDGLAAIQAQLNNLGREIKKVNEKVYASQVGCESCKGPHYTKDYPLKEKVKAFEEAFYTQYGVPFPPGGRFRAAALGFYQRDNRNPSYQERRQTMEESMNKFMAESAKRHDKNSILIKEICSSTDAAAIRNQGASIKALEIQIGDHVKSILTTIENDTTSIRRIGGARYAVLDNQNIMQTFKPNQSTIPFPSRLTDDCYDEMVLDSATYGIFEEGQRMEDQ
ncbi:hypothetical protein Tco_1315159 [Tanacetum coccineum]